MKKIFIYLIFVLNFYSVYADDFKSNIVKDIENENIHAFVFLNYHEIKNSAYLESIHVTITPEKLENIYTYKIERKSFDDQCRKNILSWINSLNYNKINEIKTHPDFVNALFILSEKYIYKIFFDYNFTIMNFENNYYYINNPSDLKKNFLNSCTY